jgi:hypothetical protein
MMSHESSSSNPARSERRGTARQFASSYARVECRKGTLGLGPDLAAACVDISEAGIGLVVKESLEPGQEVELLFDAPGFGRPLKRAAQVVWSAAAEGGGWRIGLRFDKALSYHELQRLTKG